MKRATLPKLEAALKAKFNAAVSGWKLFIRVKTVVTWWWSTESKKRRESTELLGSLFEKRELTMTYQDLT